MKRIFSAVLALAMIFAAVPVVNSSAVTAEESLQYLEYKITNGEVTITDCDTSAREIVVPNTIEGYPVTKIGDMAFFGCSGLASITISDSVKSIGYSAFYNCTSLTAVDIPRNVTSIGDSAFSQCTALTKVDIPYGVTSIGGSVFANCTSLTAVDIPHSVTSVGDSAFYNCTALTEVHLPYSVKSIGESAFNKCKALKVISIPYGVECIEWGTFAECSSLASITIPDSVTSIGPNAFSSCSSLTSVTIPKGVAVIEESAFYNCSGLTTITIPNSVCVIGSLSFYGCSSLTSVTIHKSVTGIYSNAFNNCYKLNEVYYMGTEDQWNAINIYFGNDKLTSANIMYHEECEEVELSEVMPTCTENGSSGGVICAVCGDYVIEPEIYSALGHEIIIHEAKMPTCIEIGWDKYETCSRCDHNTYVELPVTDHNYENGACTVCGEKDMAAVLKGDVDSDGKINAVDLFKMKLFVKQMLNATETETLAADVTNDGKINALDLFELKYRVLNGVWRTE